VLKENGDINYVCLIWKNVEIIYESFLLILHAYYLNFWDINNSSGKRVVMHIAMIGKAWN
jgi:hypothetical protein